MLKNSNRFFLKLKKAILDPNKIPIYLNNKLKLYYYLESLNKFPTEIVLNITNNCNFKCLMCDIGQKNSKSNLTSTWKIDTNDSLTLEDWKQFIDNIAVYNPTIQLTGPEPMISKNFIEIIQYLKEKKLRVGITTNGWLLSKHLETLFALKVNYIGISIDGLEDVHDKMRGVNGSFKRIIDCFKAAEKLQKRYPNHTEIITNTTITKLNYLQLEELVQKISEYNVSSIYLSHLWSRDKLSVTEHNKIYGKRWKALETNTYMDVKDIDINILKKTLIKIKNKYSNISFYPKLTENELIKYYTNPTSKIVRKCMVPWNQLDIFSNGDIVIGGQCFNVKPLGNIKTDNIKEIWVGTKYTEFRNELKKNSFYFPGCSKCCALFKYDIPPNSF